MKMSDPRIELNDPSTTPERLAALAQAHPELGSLIAAHPNAYPELQAWIAQYASAAEAMQANNQAVGAQPDQQFAAQQFQTQQFQTQEFATQQFQAQQFDTQQFQTQQWASQGQPQGYDPVQPMAFGQQPGQGVQKKSKKVLLFSLIGLLVLLLAGGGVAWWLLAGKIGGSSSPEAAAKKLVTGVANLDPLALYGSFAPSEFAAFEPASKQALETRTDKETKSAEELLSQLKSEVKVEITEPLETENTELVEGEVERVVFTSGEIKLDGDPTKVADAIFGFYGPILEAQAESYDYSLSKRDIADMRDDLEDELKDQLPFTLDFSDLSDLGAPRDFELSVVSVREGGSWFVSPVLTFADYAHLQSGNSDRELGDSIIEPAKNGAKSAAEAADLLTQAVFDADYDAIVEQMPLPERRFFSIYGKTFMIEDAFASMSEDSELSLEESKFKQKGDDPSRVTIDQLSFSTSAYSWETGEDYKQNLSFEDGKKGFCMTMEGKRPTYVDIYDEYGDLFDAWLDDSTTRLGFEEWLESKGYGVEEMEEFSETTCLRDVPGINLDALGVDEWAVIAIEEGGAWKITPLGTVADISAIITKKIAEAAEKGKLDSLFAA